MLILPLSLQGAAAREPFKILRAALLSAAVLCLALGNPLSAQIGGQGSITGTVIDPSGAVVPNATVTATNNATNNATNEKTTQNSSSSGVFTLSPLNPGTYTVTFSAPGFKTLT